jgi:hypothetical protein
MSLKDGAPDNTTKTVLLLVLLLEITCILASAPPSAGTAIVTIATGLAVKATGSVIVKLDIPAGARNFLAKSIVPSAALANVNTIKQLSIIINFFMIKILLKVI